MRIRYIGTLILRRADDLYEGKTVVYSFKGLTRVAKIIDIIGANCTLSDDNKIHSLTLEEIFVKGTKLMYPIKQSQILPAITNNTLEKLRQGVKVNFNIIESNNVEFAKLISDDDYSAEEVNDLIDKAYLLGYRQGQTGKSMSRVQVLEHVLNN